MERETSSPTTPVRSTLFANPSFVGMTVAQFLGAFNDNVTKQLALLVCLKETADDKQALATAVFAVPFLLFSGTAGYLADRLPKTLIVRGCKIAEFAIQATGLFAALAIAIWGGYLYIALVCVLFLMGAHSAIFGPSKYGILPEILRENELPLANAVFVSTTFMAIVFGMPMAGILLSFGGDRLTTGVIIGCTGGLVFALLGVIASLRVRMTKAAQPTMEFSAKHIAVDPASWKLIFADPTLLGAMTASGVFYLCGAAVQQAANAFGVKQLELSDESTSAMLSAVAIGIGVGCMMSGWLCAGRADYRIAKTGATIASACLLGLAFIPVHSLVLPTIFLFGVGFGGGMLAVPLSVVIQTRPPAEHKGRVLAAMSWFNWIGVLLSAAFYAICLLIRTRMGWPPCVVFAAIAIPLSGIAIFLPGRVIASRHADVE